MTPADREKVRFHLANAYNEADLLIRNHLSFERDVKRQEQDFKGMKVFERIPLTDNFQDLKDQLEDSAKQHHVELSFFQVGKRNPVDTSSIPKTIYSSDEFKIPSDKLVETIPLHLALPGARKPIFANGFRNGMMKFCASWSRAVKFTPSVKVRAKGNLN